MQYDENRFQTPQEKLMHQIDTEIQASFKRHMEKTPHEKDKDRAIWLACLQFGCTPDDILDASYDETTCQLTVQFKQPVQRITFEGVLINHVDNNTDINLKPITSKNDPHGHFTKHNRA